MDWRILALAGPLAFVTYQGLAKLLPQGTPVFLINAYALFVGSVFMLLLHLSTAADKSLSTSNKQMLLAVGIGLCLGLGNLSIVKAYSLGAPQGLFTLIFYVALIIYGVLVGYLVWSERLNLPQLLGILLAGAGIALAVLYRKD